MGLTLAYFAFRYNLPLKVRSGLFPIIGQRIHGPIGDAVDTFATIGTVFGVATTLGFGVTQINSGLNYLFGWESNISTQIFLIIVVSTLASLSVFLGLDKGIKRLSELNLILALVLLGFVFLASSSIYILQATIQNAGQYISNLFSMTFNLYAYQSNGWIGGWTIMYWAWWISWSPFVGMFIARVSKGRNYSRVYCWCTAYSDRLYLDLDGFYWQCCLVQYYGTRAGWANFCGTKRFISCIV